jgi:hypothetical protein
VPARPSPAPAWVGSRRAALRGLLLAPLCAALPASPARAKDYASAAELFEAIDRLQAELDARLLSFERGLPSARPLVASFRADHQRHRAERAELRRRLRLRRSMPPRPAGGNDLDLDRLRASQEALVYAHAEGLPALGDERAVDVMARHMVDLSRQLAVIDLWIEAEARRG